MIGLCPEKIFELYPPDKVTLPPVDENDLGDIPPIGKMIAGWDFLHEKVIKANQWRPAVSAYLADISFADAMVGKVLDTLYASSYAENTVIVLWSDHGFHRGEKSRWRKLGLWEEATHTPLIVVVPDITKPDGRGARSVSLLDIYPTLIDLCGLAPKDELEGNSLRPLLENPTAPWEYPAITTARFVGNSHSVRTERWRYIRYHDDSEELYDHAVDEFEWVNLANKPEYNGVKGELARWLRTVNAADAPFEI